MMKKYIIEIALLINGLVVAFGQDLNFQNLSHLSPNVASLSMYQSIPVGHYTGVPKISIPIYNINLDGKEIPIDLSYHASGIKLQQEASWVGLGWALQAGGVITKHINDFDDFGKSIKTTYENKTETSNQHVVRGYYFLNPLTADVNNNFNVDSSSPSFSLSEFTEVVNHVTQYVNWDAEPDIFKYTMPGLSGQMIIQRRELQQDKIRPKATQLKNEAFIEATYDTTKDSWILKDDKGYIYYVGKKELSDTYIRSMNINTTLKKNDIIPSAASPFSHSPITSAWLLDSIVSSKNNSVKFIYATEDITTPVQISETNMINLDVLGERIYSAQHSVSVIKQHFLKTITFNEGSINFSTSDRYDIDAFKTTSAGQKLENIQIKNSLGQTIKTVSFSYSYMGNINSANECRLILECI